MAPLCLPPNDATEVQVKLSVRLATKDLYIYQPCANMRTFTEMNVGPTHILCHICMSYVHYLHICMSKFLHKFPMSQKLI